MNETTGLVWVIMYGANLDPVLRFQRVGGVAVEVPGTIVGHRLAFQKRSIRNPAVLFANIVPDTSANCPAVAMLFSLEQILILDFFEGTPAHYSHEMVEFRPNGKTGPASGIAWIAQPEWVSSEGRVSEQYLDGIRRGYAHYGLPLELLQQALSA